MASNVTQAIDKIKFLLEQGIINEAEFKEKKNQIIEDFLNADGSSEEYDSVEDYTGSQSEEPSRSRSASASYDDYPPPRIVVQPETPESSEEQAPPQKALTSARDRQRADSLVAEKVKILEDAASSNSTQTSHHDITTCSESESMTRGKPVPPPSKPGVDAIIDIQICEAAWKGDLLTVKNKLKDKSVDHINRIRNDRNQSILYCACRQGQAKVVRYLLSFPGLDLSSEQASNKSTPLHGACFGGHGGIVAALLLHGADINVQNVFGHVPFDELHNHVKPAVHGFQNHGLNGIYQYLPPWSAKVTVSLEKVIGLPIVKSHRTKTYFEVKLTLFGHSELPLAPSQTVRGKWVHADAAPSKIVWDEKAADPHNTGVCHFFCGHIQQASITVRIEISHSSSKYLTYDACSHTSYTCTPNPPSNYKVKVKDHGLTNRGPDEATISFGMTVQEFDDLMAKEYALELASLNGKLDQRLLFTFLNTMRDLIQEIDQRIVSESQLGKGKASKTPKKKGAVRLTREPRGEFAVFRKAVIGDNYGPILFIVQFLPVFLAEYMFATKFGLNKSLADFVREDIVENKAWYRAHLDGQECPWLVLPKQDVTSAPKAEKEDVSFRYL